MPANFVHKKVCKIKQYLLLTLRPDRKEFKQRFGLALVFLATRSGLTRWQDFPDSMGGENTSNAPHFKDMHSKAIDEVWYKRAVEQNYDDPERFVYSVPFDSGVLGSEVEEKEGEILVTASNAIFVENGNVKAPAAVVGFQFQHSALHSLFMNITSSCPTDIGDTCKEHLTCKSEDLECYVLDSNAYIILSENKEHTGYFFGEVRGFVMERLVAMNVYRRVHIYDYQGVCFVGEKTDKSHSNYLKNPLHWISWFGNWVLTNIFWFFAEFNLEWIGALASPFANDNEGVVIDQQSTEPEDGEGGDGEDIMVEEEGEGGDDIEPTMGGPSENNIKDVYGKVMINRTRPAPCTMEVDLYQLVPERERQEQDSPHNRQCDPPFVVQSIHRSDMILVVVEATCPSASDPSAHHMNVIPSEVYYNGTTLNCQKIRFKHKMTRVRPTSCIKEHEKEEDIKLCGNGIKLNVNHFLQITCCIFIILLSKLS